MDETIIQYNREECIICFYDKPIEEYICFSCGHKVCATCYPLMKNTCPICRYIETELMRIEVVIPTRNVEINTAPVLQINYAQIIMNSVCAIICCIIIYAVVVVPIQRLD